MDFPQLGAHCAVKDCNLLDYLPFECDHCHLKFCLDHKNTVDHNCSQFKRDQEISHPCPICHKLIQLSDFNNIDEAISIHIDNGCKSQQQMKYNCTFSKCTSKEFIKIICNLCHDNYCLKHRFPSDHKCVAFDPLNNSGIHNTSKPIESSAAKRTQTSSSSSTANKKSTPSDRDLHNESKKQLDELRRLREEKKGEYRSERQKGEIVIIQTNGTKLSHVFDQYDSLRSVQQYINSNRTDGNQAYAVLPENSNKPYQIEDLSKSLEELKLFPFGVLKMVLFNNNNNYRSNNSSNNNSGGGIFGYVRSFFS